MIQLPKSSSSTIVLCVLGASIAYAIFSASDFPDFSQSARYIPSGQTQVAAISGAGSGLVGHYTFDEGGGSSAGDSSGSGYTGTLFNAPSWISGRVGSGAISFDGVDDYVRVKTGTIAAALPDSTVSIWFRTSFTSNSGGVAMYSERASSGSDIFKLDFGSVTAPSEPFFTWRNDAGSLSQIHIPAVLNFSDNTWHNFTVVIKETAVTLYVDGVERTTGTISTQNFTNSGLESWVGRDKGDNASKWTGGLDDLRIYNRALTDSEISEIYSLAGSPPTGDTEAPIISSVISNSVTQSEASISWSTDESSDTQIEYGLTTSYGNSTTLNASLATSHSQALTGLSANTVYHYRVKSKDAAGNLSVSPDAVFTTTAAAAPSDAGDQSATTLTRVSGDISFTWQMNCGGRPCRYGTFVNGDFWVAPIDDQGNSTGSVTVTDILAAGVSRVADGAEVNPSNILKQGILTLRPNSYDASKNIMTQLPYAATPGQSIFKASVNSTVTGCRDTNGCIASDDVLTVLSSIPENNGATIFRPPFHGTWKPLFSTTKVRLERLSSISAISATNQQSFAALSVGIIRTWTVPVYEIGHVNGDTDLYRIMSPLAVLNNYGAYQSGAYMGGVLAVLGSDPVSAKTMPVYALMQKGIDTYGVLRADIPLGSGAGQHLGKKPALAFFAALYDDPSVLNEIRSVASNSSYLSRGFFQEDSQVRRAPTGAVIWGEETHEEATYWLRHFGQWAAINKGGTGYDNKGAEGDPYNYIDGPAGGTVITNSSGRNYQPVAAPYLVQYGFLQTLMPWYRYANGDNEIIEYADRVQGRGISGWGGGVWTQPDPCAEVDIRETVTCSPYTPTSCLYYKVTWGPDPAKPGQCIYHNGNQNTQGRWANQHGSPLPKMSGTYGTLWNSLRNCSDPAHASYPCAGMGPEGPDSNPPIQMHSGNTSGGTPTVPTPPATPDTTPPTTPSNLAATAISSTQVNLSWGASTDSLGVVGYKIYRGTAQIATSTGVSYSNTGLTPSTAYAYSVAAYDAAGNVSTKSASASATTPSGVSADTTLPAVSITAPSGTVSGIAVSVTASASDNVGVVGVQFKLDGANLGSEDVSSPYATTWNTSGATNGSHTLTAIARDAAGNTKTSTAVTVTVSNSTPSFTIAVTKAGTGSGTVSSNVGGLSCGSACSVSLASGSSVTLSAVPSSGSAFLGWSGACTGTGTCIRSITSNTTVTATFGLAPDTSVPSTPAGLTSSSLTQTGLTLSWLAAVDNVGVSGYRIYRNGTLIASPTTNSYAVSGLSEGTIYSFKVLAYDAAGNESSQSNALTITTASIPVATYELTAAKSGTGQGTVTGSGLNCGSTCTTSVTNGTTVTLTASPFSGSTFSGWSGACTGTDACTVTVSSASSVTASFASVPQTTTGSGSSGTTTYIPPTATPFIPAVPQASAPQTGLVITKDLWVGITDPQVLTLQRHLVSQGYLTATPTGYFGPATEAAVKKYQVSKAINPTGTVGPVTRASLASGAAAVTQAPSTIPAAFTRALSLGSKGNDVKALQVFLNTHGFPLAATGAGSKGNETINFSVLTQRAVIRYQLAKGITPAVGYFGVKTMGAVNAGR